MRLRHHLGYRPLLQMLLYQDLLCTKQEEREEEKEVVRRRADPKHIEGETDAPYDMERLSTTPTTPETLSGTTFRVGSGAWTWWRAWNSRNSALLV